MLGQIGMPRQELMIVDEDAADMNQPARQERDNDRDGGKDMIVDRQPGRNDHRGSGGRQRMAGIEQQIDPDIAAGGSGRIVLGLHRHGGLETGVAASAVGPRR